MNAVKTALGWLLVILAAALGLWIMGQGARGDERGDWFRSLKQPGTMISCCDISDCRRTQAKWHNGQWTAIVRGHPRNIPASRILNDTATIDGEAYVCASESGPADTATIYCFVRPGGGV